MPLDGWPADSAAFIAAMKIVRESESRRLQVCIYFSSVRLSDPVCYECSLISTLQLLVVAPNANRCPRTLKAQIHGKGLSPTNGAALMRLCRQWWSPSVARSYRAAWSASHRPTRVPSETCKSASSATSRRCGSTWQCCIRGIARRLMRSVRHIRSHPRRSRSRNAAKADTRGAHRVWRRQHCCTWRPGTATPGLRCSCHSLHATVSQLLKRVLCGSHYLEEPLDSLSTILTLFASCLLIEASQCSAVIGVSCRGFYEH